MSWAKKTSIEKDQIKFIVFIIGEIVASTFTGIIFFSEWENVELEKQQTLKNLELKEKELEKMLLEKEKLEIEIETAEVEKQLAKEELQSIIEKKLLIDIDIIKIRLEKCNVLNEINEEILRESSDQIFFYHNTDVAEELLNKLRITANDCKLLPTLDAGNVGRLGMLWTILMLSIPATVSVYLSRKKQRKL